MGRGVGEGQPVRPTFFLQRTQRVFFLGWGGPASAAAWPSWGQEAVSWRVGAEESVEEGVGAAEAVAEAECEGVPASAMEGVEVEGMGMGLEEAVDAVDPRLDMDAGDVSDAAAAIGSCRFFSASCTRPAPRSPSSFVKDGQRRGG